MRQILSILLLALAPFTLRMEAQPALEAQLTVTEMRTQRAEGLIKLNRYYMSQFQDLLEQVGSDREEAVRIVNYMQTLQREIQTLEALLESVSTAEKDE